MSHNSDPSVNEHHVLYQRRRLERVGGAALALRRLHPLIVPMDRQVHAALHRSREGYEGVEPGLLTREHWWDVLDTVETGLSGDRLQDLERLVGAIARQRDPGAALVAYQVERQLPFVREGVTERWY